jgi:dTDP-D-glucose 4,6-dehydratase
MKGLSLAGQAPFAPYHWLLYSESLWFDTTKAQTELGWSSTRSNEDALIESYEWFLANRGSMAEGAAGSGSGSHHQSPVKLGVLRLLKRLG